MTRDELLALAEPRWRALRERRADLAGAIDLQRVLVTRGLDLGAALDRQPAPSARPHGVLAARLASGEPVRLDESAAVDAALLAPYLLGFCDDLAAGGAGSPARHLRDVLERGEIDVGSLLAASLGRRQAAIRTRAQHVGVSPDLTWVVAEMGVGPVAYREQRRTLGEAGPELRAGLARWGHGFCPACGSWPALAELHGGARHLRCSFCGVDWCFAGRRCLYCGAGAEALLTAAGASEAQRAELCRACGGYLKCVASAAPAAFELLPVIDLETSDLDAGANERGYGRPSMRETDAPAMPCPPP